MKPTFLAATALAVVAPAFAQTPPAATMSLDTPAAAAPAVASDSALTSAPPAPILPPSPMLPARRRALPPSPAELRVRAANRAATLEPATSGYLNAVQIYPYADGSIYRVLTAPGQVTDIALQPGETLGAIAAGDTVRWIIGDTTSGSGDTRRTHVLAKPFAAGMATNIVITTDRRTYHLALTSTERTAMAALSWTYPQDQLIAYRAAADQAKAAHRPSSIPRRSRFEPGRRARSGSSVGSSSPSRQLVRSA